MGTAGAASTVESGKKGFMRSFPEYVVSVGFPEWCCPSPLDVCAANEAAAIQCLLSNY